MRRLLTSLALVVAAAVPAGLVLAGQAGSQRGQDGAALRVLTVGDLRTFRLPLDRYRVSRAQATTVSRARNRLYAGCMRRFGFRLEVPRGGGPVPFAGNEQRYGIDDERQAARHGYRRRPGPASRRCPRRPPPSPTGRDRGPTRGGGSRRAAASAGRCGS